MKQSKFSNLKIFKLHELKGYLSNFTFKFCRVLDIWNIGSYTCKFLHKNLFFTQTSPITEPRNTERPASHPPLVASTVARQPRPSQTNLNPPCGTFNLTVLASQVFCYISLIVFLKPLCYRSDFWLCLQVSFFLFSGFSFLVPWKNMVSHSQLSLPPLFGCPENMKTKTMS